LPEGKRECFAPRRRGSSFCFWHDPAAKAARIDAGARGGRAVRRDKEITGLLHFRFESLDTLEGLERYHRLLIAALLRGEVTTAKVRLLDELGQRIHAEMPSKAREPSIEKVRRALFAGTILADGDAREES
jgi:hypothetical protein